MAKCKNCKKLDHILNSGVSVGRWCVEKSDSPDIERERICDKYVPKTNADRIRSMTDEELAEALIFYDSEYDGYSHVFEPYITHPVKEIVKEMCLEWLKSEVGCE